RQGQMYWVPASAGMTSVAHPRALRWRHPRWRAATSPSSERWAIIRTHGATTLNQPALLNGCRNEAREQRVRGEPSRFQLPGELHADKPRMIRELDDLRQQPVG